MFFKLKPKAGSHCETDAKGNIHTYRAADGHIFDTKLDLVKMFPNKFERVEVMTTEELAAAPKVKVGAAPAKPPTKDAPASKFGEDVTAKFKEAADEDLRVFRKGEDFTVVEAEEPDVALNDKALTATGKGGVKAFIEQYLEQ